MKNNFVLSFTFKLLPPKTIKSNTLFGQNKDKMTKKIISRSHKAVAAAAVSADLACTDQKKKKKDCGWLQKHELHLFPRKSTS